MVTLSDQFFLAKLDLQLLFQGSKTWEWFKTDPKSAPGGVHFWRSLRARTGPAPAKIARLGAGNVRFGPRWGVNTTQNAFSVPGNTNNVGTDRFGGHFFRPPKVHFSTPKIAQNAFLAPLGTWNRTYGIGEVLHLAGSGFFYILFFHSPPLARYPAGPGGIALVRYGSPSGVVPPPNSVLEVANIAPRKSDIRHGL